MRFGAIAREVRAGVLTGTARIVTLALMAALVTAGLAAVDILSVRRLIAEAHAFRASGGSTLIVAAEGRIDAARCRALAGIDGVLASGAIRQRAEPMRLAALPNAPVALFEVTPGFARVLDAPGAGVTVSGEVAAALGLGGGGRMPTAGGPIEVGGVFAYPDDGRRPGLGWSALIETAEVSPFDECWLLVWPPSDAVRSLLTGVVAPGAEPPELTQLNVTHGAGFDGPALLDGRSTAWSPWLAAALVGALGLVSIRMRRLEFASDLHAGARHRDLFRVALAEAALWLTAALLVGVGASAVLAAPEAASDRGALLVLGARISVAAFVAGLGGVSTGLAGIRERRLLRYFRDR